MKFPLIKKLFFFVFFLFTIQSLFAQVNEKDLPVRSNPPTLVNDFANVLNEEQENVLENKLIAFDDSTSTQIAIITVQSTEPYAIFDYAYSLGRYWGVGQKDFNNGVVILAAIDDHEVFIATGYGIEPTVTDSRAKRIIEQDMLPQFRNENYFAGFNAATDKIIAYAKGEFDAAEDKNEDPVNLPALIIIVIIILIIISRINRNGGITYSGKGPTYWGGKSFGGFGGFSGSGSGGGSFGGFGGGGFGGGGAGGRW